VHLACRWAIRLTLGAALALVFLLAGATPAGLLTLLGVSLLPCLALTVRGRRMCQAAADSPTTARLVILPAAVLLASTLSCALPDGGIDGPSEVIWQTGTAVPKRYDLVRADTAGLPALLADSTAVLGGSMVFDLASTDVQWSEQRRAPGGAVVEIVTLGRVDHSPTLGAQDSLWFRADSVTLTTEGGGPSAFGPGHRLLYRAVR
jgi:hypothetical protein